MGLYLGNLVGVVVAVEVGEAFEVGGGPGMFALEEFVDFALGGGAAVDGGCVVVFCFADMATSSSEAFLLIIKLSEIFQNHMGVGRHTLGLNFLLQCLNRRIPSQIVQPLPCHENIRLQIIHHLGKLLGIP